MRNFKRGRSRGYRGHNKRFYGGHRSNGSGGRNRYRNKGLDLNPLMFVKKAENVIETPYIPTNSFSSFGLDERVKKNVIARGFDKPTAIQDQAILPVLKGRDVVGVANTGTGKTAAFLLPLITKVIRDRNQRVLIVVPTRELAVQIRDEFKLFSMGMGVFSTLCIGGASVHRQVEGLRRSPSFVIGTPGRIKDLSNRNKLKLERYNNVVLDEVDRMLDMGFIKDVREIVSKLPRTRQSLFFSATIPEKTRDLMDAFLTNPLNLSVTTGPTAKNVDQDIIRTNGKNKIDVLHDLLIQEGFDKVLVFGRTKWGIKKLEKNLMDRGFKVAAIHGNKSQGQRLRALRQLQADEVQILLATDVASRGLDIEDITHVINYDVPGSYDDYVHRIGRTGRAGKKGVALTFVQ